MKTIIVDFKGEGGHWRRELTHDQLKSIAVERKDIVEQHIGLKHAIEFVIEVPCVDEHARPEESLWFHACHYTHENEKNFTEWRLANDSIYHYPMYQCGQFYLSINGKVVLSSLELKLNDDDIELFDQTSFSGFFGEPFYAPHKHYKRYFDERYSQFSDKVVEREFQRVYDRVTAHQSLGRDPYRDSHFTGSMGACWEDIGLFLRRYKSDDSAGPTRLCEYIAEYYGTSFVGAEGTLHFDPGRPYHLHHYNEGADAHPFDRRNSYSVDHTEDPQPVVFYDGTIQLARGRNWKYGVGVETLGRITAEPPIVDFRESPSPSTWIGSRVNGFHGGTRRNSITARGNNGDDPEHKFRYKRVFASCLLTPSIFARNALHNLVHTFTTPEPDKHGVYIQGYRHSDRACGWPLGELAAQYLINGDEFARDQAERIFVVLESSHQHNLPDWYPEDVPGLVTRERQLANADDAKGAMSACWQAATIVDACNMWKAVGGINLDRSDNVRIAGLNVIKACYVEADKRLAENMWVNRDPSNVSRHGEETIWGTRAWCNGVGSEQHYSKEMWKVYRSLTGRYTWQDSDERTWSWHAEPRLKNE